MNLCNFGFRGSITWSLSIWGNQLVEGRWEEIKMDGLKGVILMIKLAKHGL